MNNINPDVFCYRIKNDPSLSKNVHLISLYNGWKKSWFSLFQDMNNEAFCSSDEFSRQDYFLALFLNKKLAGYIGLREIDVSTEIGRDDSYIQPWPESFILQKTDKKILLMSGFNLDEEFRGRFLKVPSMFIFGTFIMKNFIESHNSSLITLARNDAGVNKFCSAFGATKVGFKESFHGKDCDLMEFQKENVKFYPLKRLKEIIPTPYIEDYKDISIKEAIGA